MKAIILCAGQGIRLRPLTDDRPKCMVEYQGKPILCYTLETLRKCGINDIIAVTGYRDDSIPFTDIKRFRNHEYDSTNMVYSFFSAEPELSDDIIVSYGDIIYRPNVLQALIDSTSEFSVVIDKKWQALWQARMEDPLADAETLKLDKNGNIIELGKKPKSLADIQGQYIGLFKISKKALDQVKDFYHSLDKSALYEGKNFKNMFMTSFIQNIIDHSMPVKAVPISGGWIEIDSPSDLQCEMQ